MNNNPLDDTEPILKGNQTVHKLTLKSFKDSIMANEGTNVCNV